MGYVSRHLSRIFGLLGKVIALNHKKFIAASLLMTLLFSSGMTYFQYVEDIPYLYQVLGSLSLQEQKIIKDYFPTGSGTFDPSRTTDLGRIVRSIITTKNEDSILKTEVWKEIREFDELVRSVEVDHKNYSSLCVKWKKECTRANEYIDMDTIMPDIENNSIRLVYPVMFNPKTFSAYLLPLIMGGFNLTEDGRSVLSAKAITFNYPIEHFDENEYQFGRRWEKAVTEKLTEMNSHWKHINVYTFSFYTLANEMLQNIFYVFPAVFVTSVLAGAFAVASAMMNDWVKSKPLLGIFGVLSSLMATFSAFGILCFFGVPMINLNAAVPFLLIGIGMDDCFVFLASWRKTKCNDPVPTRLAECYSEAAVSVTITTATDMLSFYVGLLTPIRGIQIFSAYAGTGVLIIYIWHIFFFGATMAMCGYLESENRHSLFWWIKAIPKSKAAAMRQTISKMFLTGGYDKDDPYNPMNEAENSMMNFFRDTFANFICNKFTQAGVIVIFIFYILISFWGLTQIQEGMEYHKFVRYNCPLADFFLKEKEYFFDYYYRIQVVIDRPLNYSSEETQTRVNELLHEIYSMEHMTDEYSENWYRDFTRFLHNYKEIYDLNITSEHDFIKTYREIYVNDGNPTSMDVVFDETNSSIIATRYIVQSKNTHTSDISKNMLIELRDIVGKYKHLNVVVFNPGFSLIDQFIAIRELTIKLVAVASCMVMFVTIVFIPNVASSLAVFFAIVFTELGVLGFMVFLNINLDFIALLCLIMCIGFSVDFSAHISYAYISSEATNSRDRIRRAMHSLGWPIVQAAISTIIGLAGLLYVPAYSFQANFYIVSLVILFSTFQGLFVLPVLFCIFKPENGIPFIYSPNKKSYSLKKCKLERF